MPWRKAGVPGPEWMQHLPPLPKLGPLLVAGRFLLPFALYGTILLLVYLLAPERFNVTLGRTLSVFPFGKFAALGGQGDFLYWVMIIGTMDVLVGLFLLWNFDLLYRIPGMGPMLHAMEARGSIFLSEHGWVRRVAFVGVVLIVIVPFQGTGAVMGSIVGRLIGLGPWRALAAIAVGGYTGVALVLSTSWLIQLLGGIDPFIAAAVLVLLVGAAIIVWRRWFHTRDPAKGKALETSEAAPARRGP